MQAAKFKTDVDAERAGVRLEEAALRFAIAAAAAALPARPRHERRAAVMTYEEAERCAVL